MQAWKNMASGMRVLVLLMKKAFMLTASPDVAGTTTCSHAVCGAPYSTALCVISAILQRTVNITNIVVELVLSKK
jgi:hypothetical protein